MSQNNTVKLIISDVQKSSRFGSSEYWKLAISDKYLLFYSPNLSEKVSGAVKNYISVQGAIGGLVSSAMDKNSDQGLTFEKIKNSSKKYLELPVEQFRQLSIKSKFLSKSISFEDNGAIQTFKLSDSQLKQVNEMIAEE
jgi:hypothetical protein